MDQTIPQGSWWSRNWKWFVPVGCVTLLMTCCCGVGGGFLYLTGSAFQSSRTYKDAVARAKADPDVQAALGTPIDTTVGMNMQFNTSYRNGVTHTQLRIPLKGPKGEGSLYVVAREENDKVLYDQLDVVVGDQVIHLPGVEARGSPTGLGGGKDVDLDEDRDEGPDEHGAEPPDITVEAATDRPGGDFRDYEIADGDAAKCALDCAESPKCRAYTFVKPAGGKPARCRLKARAAARVQSDCCVSGLKK